MEQAEKKRPVFSKKFYIAVAVAETLAKFVSIVTLIRVFSAFEDALDVDAHAGVEEKGTTLANFALPYMQSAITTLSVAIATLVVCGFLRHKMLKVVAK